MYRYVAIFCHSKENRSQHEFCEIYNSIKNKMEGWREIIRNDHLIILDIPDQESQMWCHRLEGQSGAILGHLFLKKSNYDDGSPCCRANINFGLEETQKILKTNGAALGSDYWGSYVALFQNKSCNSITIVRSPFGRLSCFCVQRNGVAIFSSDINLLSEIGGFGIEVDWDIVPIYTRYSYLFSEKTPLKGLQSLQAAQRMDIRDNKISIDRIWNPLEYCGRSAPKNIGAASSRLRNTVFSCLASWASVFPRGVLALSGGFDSSLVAGVMSKLENRPELMCVTYFDGSPFNDERCYARQTAIKTGYKLFEIEIDPQSEDFTFLKHFPKYPWPYTVPMDWRKFDQEIKIARMKDAYVKISGEGGDSLFGAFRNNASAIDYYFDNGINRDLFSVALKSARVSDTTVWASIMAMVRTPRSRQNRQWEKYASDFELNWGINPDIIEQLPKIGEIIPWYRDHNQLAPGKITQIISIMASFEYLNYTPELPFLEPLDPFLSQPVAEVCLSLPVYTLQYNGKERGLARDVFADCLADEVRLREFKSDGSPFFYKNIMNHLNFYLEFLIGGVLSERKIVDQVALEKIRSDPSDITPGQCIRLAQLSGVEAWARAWSK